MATPVIMPRQGQSVETCIITTWLRKKGDKVKTGDLLFSYETDKAAFDMESPADGILLEVFFSEGDEVPVLVNVAVIGSAGEPTDPFRPHLAGEKAIKETVVPESSPERTAAVAAAPDEGTAGRKKLSPRAKILAEKKGIDLNSISGTGPGGRIIVRDIMNPETRTAQPVNGFRDQPLTNVRKLIAKAMHSSIQNSAQLTHHMSADVRNLIEARKKIKERGAMNTDEQDVTLNDMICFCVIKALQKFPEMNSHFFDDKIRTFDNVHLGMAVDTPRGLMVPVVKNADTLDLLTLSKELRKAAEACRKGNIDPEMLKSSAGSFTVSNLGNYGVEMFTPVINLPQAGILGVCTITHRPADIGNGVFGFIPVMGLSLTYDHRAVDGGPATLFLKEIKKNIENLIMPPTP
jgi:pyruvate dehydrogenase E2 component (dihydrolipoamide acetyltransferase)